MTPNRRPDPPLTSAVAEHTGGGHFVFIECRGHRARVDSHAAYRAVCSTCSWQGADQGRLEPAAAAAWLHEHGEAHGDRRLVCMDDEVIVPSVADPVQEEPIARLAEEVSS